MTPEQRVSYLTGQISALGAAVHVLLKTHPNREEISLSLHEALEAQIARQLASSLPDEMRKGIESARDLFLLKKQEP
jgi:hypothetical protein